MIKILVVEDDKILSDSIESVVKELGEITQIYDGEEGLYEAEQDIYDLILLDLMLPSMNGYEVLQQLRKRSIATPVLILTAKDGLDDKVKGFTQGADDYLTKPFHREELLLRAKALLKRTLGLHEENRLKLGEIECDLGSRVVHYQNQEFILQGKEFDLLTYLIQNKNMIVTKEQIFDRIWGFDSETSLTVVEVYMSNLRKHMKATGLDKKIKTLRNVGYMLDAKE
ncbi:response regulator transcription factor [Vagococcus entomophilus]|uniref:DNA-binding response regulator n=1 Tax=Vagococcus entomophilus TaxID=1160095 RepID=A0A430AIN9_9ENTE|nr:response regulator transcription factor [Vagococcus entomophilus]RSU07979.1 DNA-binding response regulator [Vagococcus entomophilus]